MTGWMLEGACTQIGWQPFYVGEAGEAMHYETARATCGGCPVRHECLEYALQIDDRHGMWGGLTPRERDELRKERGLTRATAEPRNDAELLRRYDSLGIGGGRDLAESLGISLDALHARIARARRRHQVAA